MRKSPVDPSNDQGKVVSLQLDAEFYYNRAIQSLERHRYDKALKYFRLSIEKDPENPVNYCNLAGLLAELGEFDEANRVLEMVLSDVDPEFHECFYYMANNYAYLGEYELAERLLLEYIKREPSGEYIEEVEEMLELLADELGRPSREYLVETLPKHLQEHEQTRKLLEMGDFSEASKLLQEMIRKYPDYWPAYNNLSLARYYMGEMREALALSEQVLENDPHNLHAQCNRVLIMHQTGDHTTVQVLVQRLKKLIPLNGDHLYKLAITFGILGEHEAAYQLFYKLFRLSDHLDASFFHQLAAAAWNTGRLQKAKRYWERAKALDSQSNVPRFYLDQLHHWLVFPKERIPDVPYHYQLPFEEKLFQLQYREKTIEPFHLETDPLLKASFFWVFKGQDQRAKVLVIQLLGMMASEETEELLRHYLVMETKEDDECKKLALLMLRQMGSKPPYSIWLQDQLVVIERAKSGQPFVNRAWNQVLLCLQEGMRAYSTEQKNDAKTLLLTFLQRQKERLPMVRRIEGWAAALEYVVAKHHGLSLTQSEVAKKYQVSPSTVSNCAKKLSPLIH